MAKNKSRVFRHFPHPAALGDRMREMAMVLSKKHLAMNLIHQPDELVGV